MTGLEVAAAALVVVTWPVTQFAVMIAVILLPGAAADRARARWHRPRPVNTPPPKEDT